jgi:hypothetical protein
MEFIHDATGSIATFIIYTLALSGLAMFFFKYVKKYIPLSRKTYLKIHQLVTMLFIAVVAVHFFTTDKGNIYVVSAMVLLAVVFILGSSLRVKSIKAKSFKKVVYAKAAVLIISMLLLTAGHGIFEKEHKEHTQNDSSDTFVIR